MRVERDRRPRVLVAAGRDPSGSAGLDADREAVEAAGGRFVGVTTTNTDQSGGRVLRVEPRAEEVWFAEAERAMAEPCAVLKFGLLAREAAVEAAARLAHRFRAASGEWVVLDPVLAATGGERFLAPPAVGRLVALLAELRPVLTPNVVELAELAQVRVESLRAEPEARVEAARTLVAAGATAVCVKGGHGLEDPVVDLLVGCGPAAVRHVHPRLPGGGLRGSGCRFASYLAARLAHGDDLTRAHRRASAWMGERLARAAAGA